MTYSDNDEHWTENLESILDSGADHSALPLHFATVGEAVRVAEVVLGDFCFKEQSARAWVCASPSDPVCDQRVHVWLQHDFHQHDPAPAPGFALEDISHMENFEGDLSDDAVHDAAGGALDAEDSPVDGIRLSMSSTLKEHALIAEHEAVAAAVGDSERKPKGVAKPDEPTPQEIAEHMITHQPYRAWCSQCVAHRGRQDQHHDLDHAHTSESVVSLDFGFCKRQESEENLLTVVVIHDRQTKALHAIPTMSKGGQALSYLTTECTRFVTWLGHREVCFKSDGEPAIKAVVKSVEKACRQLGVKTRSVTAPVEDHEANGAVEQAWQSIRAKAVCWLDKSKSSAAPKVVLGYLRTSAKGLFLTRSVRRLVEKADCEQEGCSSTGDPVEAGTQDAPLMTSRQAAMQARSGEAAAAEIGDQWYEHEDEEVDWAFTYKELDLNAIESKLILPRLADEFELARLGNMKVVAREDHCGSRDQGAETGVASQIPVLPAMFTYLQEEATEVSYEDSVTGRRSGIPGCLSAFVMK
ncbi:unnamed protein product [Symbiodinium necroappetens]|uniref:Integrase catalytic domain-containing protein n=1 Tax=Symbiodinium necroappetens TaxID=1628268 RepID=A0A812ZEN4_9DINO|nr:unnamed protein product [Symbiodinium necroappetens]